METWILGVLRRVERIQEDRSEQVLLWDPEETGLAIAESKWRRRKVEHKMAEEHRKPNEE